MEEDVDGGGLVIVVFVGSGPRRGIRSRGYLR